MGVSIDIVYLENFPVEDLQHAFEVGLHIDGVENQDYNDNRSQMVHLVACKDEKKEVHKGFPQTPNGSPLMPKLNSVVNDEQSRMADKKTFSRFSRVGDVPKFLRVCQLSILCVAISVTHWQA